MQSSPCSTASQPHGVTQRLVTALVAGVALFAFLGTGHAMAADAPALILSNGNFRAYDSMSASEIQAYLDTQSGPLKSLVTPDYDKVITLSKTTNNLNTTPDKGEVPKTKRASLIIWEACQYWHINPMVMLTMLEKEQSLLTRTSLTSTTLSRAIGAGCPGSLVYPSTNPIATNRYPGFGNQIWYGAKLLDGYGEGKNGSTIPLYYPGIYVWDRYREPDVKVYPGSLATYKLYIYNPSIDGNTNFWKIYSARFGNPASEVSGPPGAVFRFYKRSDGSHFYTASTTEANSVRAGLYSAYKYEGIAYIADQTNSANSAPLYRFYNKKNGSHFYTSSAAERDNVKARFSKTYTLEGVAYNVSTAPVEGAVTVYRFFNKSGSHFYTSSTAERDNVKATLSSKFTYEGIAFYVMP